MIDENVLAEYDRKTAAALAEVTHPWAKKPGMPKRLEALNAPKLSRPFVFCTAIYGPPGDWFSAPNLPSNLIDSVVRYTNLPVEPKGVNIPLGSDEIFEYPFVWFTGHKPITLTKKEQTNLKAYVDRGGLIFMDDHNHDTSGKFHKSVLVEIGRVFGPKALKKLPNEHEVYKCFFKFDEPPATTHEQNGWGDDLIHRYLMGIEVNGRVGLFWSNKDYSSTWDYHYESKKFEAIDPTRFGVNLIIYALTR